MKIKTEERADYGPAKEKRVAVQWQRLEIVKVAGAPAMPPAGSAEAAHDIYKKLMGFQPVEIAAVLCLSAKNYPIGFFQVGQGGPESVSFEPGDVFRPVLVSGAPAFIFFP